MASELLGWMEDLRQVVAGLRQRLELQRGGHGIDYTGEAYRDRVGRAVARIHPRRMRLRVHERLEETPSTATLRLERVDDAPLPPFRAGQYVNLYVDVAGVATSRPYSISSAPGSDHLDLTVRRKPGGFVSPHLLDAVRVGDTLESSGPCGQFYVEPLIDRGDLVFLAGGSGITPMMSMIRDHAARGFGGRRISLLYGSRDTDDVIFRAELERLAADHDQLNYALVLSEPPSDYEGPTGFLDAGLIRDHVGDLAGVTFFVCGPNAMYDHVRAQLDALEVPPHRIRRELYGPPDDVSAAPDWPADVAADDTFEVRVVGHDPITARASEPLINSLERHGIAVRAQCRSGECSYCRVKLVSGQVYMPAHTGLRESDVAGGYVHSCVSYPLSDLELIR